MTTFASYSPISRASRQNFLLALHVRALRLPRLRDYGASNGFSPPTTYEADATSTLRGEKLGAYAYGMSFRLIG